MKALQVTNQSSSKRPSSGFNRCIICGSTHAVPLFAVDQVPIHPFCPPVRLQLKPGFGRLAIAGCHRCGHMFNSAFEVDRVDDLYASSVLTNTPVSESMITSLETTADFILDHASPNPSIVDVGGGTGALARAMVPRAGEVHLVEPSRALTAEQFAGTGVVLHRSMFPAPSLGTRKFDVIVCRQVIEHIPDPEEFLRGLRAHLRDNGIAYIETPSAEYIETNLSVVDFHYPHVHYYRRHVLEVLFSRAGFSIVEGVEIKDGHDVGFILRPAAPQSNPSDASNDLGRSEAFLTLATNLAKRRSSGRDRLAALRGKIALYGANAYSQALLGLYGDCANYTAMFDDTPMYEGQRAYGPNIDLEISRPRSDLLSRISAVIITAYLHDVVINRKLREFGFAGEVLSVRSDASAGDGNHPSSLFVP